MPCMKCCVPLVPSSDYYGPQHISVAQSNKAAIKRTKVIVNGDRNVFCYEAWEGKKGWAKIYIQPERLCSNCGQEPESDLITGEVKFERTSSM